MTYQFRALADQAMADGAITAEEVLGLRRAGWGDGRIDPAEADALFTLNDHLTQRTPEWVDFFVEAEVEFLLAGGHPRGFISDAQAEWLIGHIDADGRIDTMAELELLARLLEKAEVAPERLKAYALNQIEQTILTGTGPTRDGGACEPGKVTASECRLLRRFLFAFAGEGNGCVSQTEADMLFRIKDATLGADNAPEWQTLFVHGVANHLMAWNAYHPVSTEKAIELETFMSDTTPHVGAFFGRMAKAEIGSGAARVLGFGRKGVTAAQHEAEVAAAHKVTEVEDAWLQARIDANGMLDPMEKALLRFIAEEERR